jgi:hypothetical protein
MISAALELVLLFAQIGPKEEAEFKKAEAKLAEKEDDSAANLIVGKYHLVKGDGDKAVPFLLKGSEDSLKNAAKADGEAADKNGVALVQVGDLWTQAVAKNKPIRQACLDRAGHWYAKAWPDLDDAGKAKLRDRLSKLYAVQGPVGVVKEMGFGTAGKTKIGPASGSARSGTASLKLDVGNDAGLRDVGGTQSIELRPGDVEVSFWVLTDGTDTIDDKVSVVFLDGDRKAVERFETHLLKDIPIWVRYTKSLTLPEGTGSCKLNILLASHKGTIRIDDISIKQKGKELIPWGGFEK